MAHRAIWTDKLEARGLGEQVETEKFDYTLALELKDQGFDLQQTMGVLQDSPVAQSQDDPSAYAERLAMKAERAAPADEEAWARGLATLKSRVFSGTDRSRLWRRARRRHPGEVLELELVTRPDTHDLAALEDLLRELERA